VDGRAVLLVDFKSWITNGGHFMNIHIYGSDKMPSVGIILLLMLFSPLLSSGMEESVKDNRIVAPGPNDVYIGPNSIMVPLNYILLVKRKNEFGAIKFTEFWHGKDDRDRYARYTSYYSNNESDPFSGRNVEIYSGELSFPYPKGVGRLSFSLGNKEVKVGPMKLLWTGKGYVHFYCEGQEQRDHGIQLSPTKWKGISEVNVFDSRLQWYKYDGERQRIVSDIDRIW
jgi:hypothetical protein